MTENSILKSLEWRYATKKFDATKKIPSNQMDIILKAANLTATSLGIQPFKLILIDDRKVIKSLEEITHFQKSIQTCSHLLVICAETHINDAYVDEYISYVEHERKLKQGTLDAYNAMCKSYINSLSDDEKIDWIKHQSYIILGNLLTVCATLEIDSCPIEGFNAKKLDQLFNLKEKHLQSVLLLPMGYRAEDDHFADMSKVRKPLEDMVIRITQERNID